MILQILKNNWLSVALFVFSVGLIVNTQIVSGQRDAAIAERDLARNQVSVLGGQIEEQNNAVLALEAAAAQNREVYLAGLEAANRKAVRLEINAADYLNMPIPSDPQEACLVADQILGEVTQ